MEIKCTPENYSNDFSILKFVSVLVQWKASWVEDFSIKETLDTSLISG